MPPLTNFFTSFNDPEYADVLLHLSTSVEVCEGSEPSDASTDSDNSVAVPEPQQGTATLSVRTYYLHSLLLIHHSHYFRGRLANAWPQHAIRHGTRDVAVGSDAETDEDGSDAAVVRCDSDAAPGKGDLGAVAAKAGSDAAVVKGESDAAASEAGSDTAVVVAQSDAPATEVESDAAAVELELGAEVIEDWSDAEAVEGSTAAAQSDVVAGARDVAQDTSTNIRLKAYKEVTELVEEAELNAMDELLKLMYTQEVPSDAAPKLLLMCLKLADRYQAVHCSELLLAHLAAKGREVITCSVAVQLYEMPPGLQEHAAFKDLLRTCKEVVVSEFRYVPGVISSDEQRQQFCALPFAAVLAWAESPQLRVDVENCVLYLLSAWVAAQSNQAGGQCVSAEQLQQLAHQVRVLHLSPAYQYFILPHLPWFKSCSGMTHLPELLAQKGTNDEHVPVFPSPRHGKPSNSGWEWEGPAAWVTGPRLRISAAPQCVTFTMSWELGLSELQQLYDGHWTQSPSHMYINGFQMCIKMRRQSSEKGVTLGMFSFISQQLMSKHGLAWSATASATLKKITYKISAPTATNANLWQTKVTEGSRRRLDGSRRGYDDILGRSAPTMEELVAPLLVEGKLRVEMGVQGVDLPA